VFLPPEADKKEWHIHDLLTAWFPCTSSEWSMTVVLQRKGPLGTTRSESPETDGGNHRGISPSAVKFHLVEPLVIDGRSARIGAILYCQPESCLLGQKPIINICYHELIGSISPLSRHISIAAVGRPGSLCGEPTQLSNYSP
jgi:hypothetical protein